MIFRKVPDLFPISNAGGPLPPLRSVAAAALLTCAACSRPVATTTWHCPGGDSIVAGLGPRYAELHLPPARRVRLYAAPAASGMKFSDGRYTLHAKGSEALLERGGRLLLRDCRSGPSVAAPDSAPGPMLARALADSIDSITAAAEPRVRRLQPEAPGWEPRVLSLWTDSAGPVRLSVTEADDKGVMSGRTDYYFDAGRLAVVFGPVSRYVFRDTTLILWTTDSTQRVAEIPLRDMVARQNFVLGEIRQYLAMFGIEP